MQTTEFLDYLKSHEATTSLAESLDELLRFRRESTARRSVRAQVERQPVRVAS